MTWRVPHLKSDSSQYEARGFMCLFPMRYHCFLPPPSQPSFNDLASIQYRASCFKNSPLNSLKQGSRRRNLTLLLDEGYRIASTNVPAVSGTDPLPSDIRLIHMQVRESRQKNKESSENSVGLSTPMRPMFLL